MLKIDGAPEGSRHHGGCLLQRQSLPPQQVVRDVRHDLRIRLQRTLISEHLHAAAVGVVGGDLAVVHHRPFQQRERMGAAPPAGGCYFIATYKCVTK